MKLKITLLLLIVFGTQGYSQDLKKCREIIVLIEQSVNEGSDKKIKPHLAKDFSIANQKGPFALAILSQMLPQLKSKISSSKETGFKENDGITTFTYLNTFEKRGDLEATYVFNKNNEILELEIIKMQVQNSNQNANVKTETKPEESEIQSKNTIEFPSKDGLLITGVLNEVSPDAPVILLCHMANRNKSEYTTTALEFNKLGYTTLAIDQRSGGSNFGGSNETNKRAKAKDLGTGYLDATPDIQAAVDFLYKKYDKKIVMLGSSYSSGIALFEAVKNEQLKAVISMSPNNYYGDSVESLTKVIQQIKIPYFITASKQETQIISSFFDGIQLSPQKVFFKPRANGMHGSMSLLETTEGNNEYWNAIKLFLKQI